MVKGSSHPAVARKELLRKLTLKKKKELDELKTQKEKELLQLEQDILKAEEEVKAHRTFEEKVPIPHVASRDVSLLSEEGKQIVAMQRGSVRKDRFFESDDDETSERRTLSALEKASESDDDSLEGQVEREHVDMGALESLPVAYRVGIDPLMLARVPTANLYEQMRTIYDHISTKGYVNPSEQEEMYALGSAMEQKLADVEAGNYHLDSKVARMAAASLDIKHKTSAFYVVSKDEKSMQEQYKV